MSKGNGKNLKNKKLKGDLYRINQYRPRTDARFKEKVLGALTVPPKPVYVIIPSHTCQPDSSFLRLLNSSDAVEVFARIHRTENIGSSI